MCVYFHLRPPALPVHVLTLASLGKLVSHHQQQLPTVAYCRSRQLHFPTLPKTFSDVLDFGCSGLPLPSPEPSLWSLLHCQPARAEDWGGYWGPGRQLLLITPNNSFETFSVNVNSLLAIAGDPGTMTEPLFAH